VPCSSSAPSRPQLLRPSSTFHPSNRPSRTVERGQSGDTVLVAPGFYKENITWPGRTASASSGNTAATRPLSTAIPWASALRSVPASRGHSHPRVHHHAGKVATNSGSGIVCSDGSPSILDNRVTRCQGAGIHLGSYSANFGPLVRGNEISGCWKEYRVVELRRRYLRDVRERGCPPEICYNWIHHDSLRRAPGTTAPASSATAMPLSIRTWCRKMWPRRTRDNGRGARASTSTWQLPLDILQLIVGNRNVTDAWKYGGGITMEVNSKPSS